MSSKLVDIVQFEQIDSKTINTLPKKEIKNYCSFLRTEIIDAVSTNGGHLSSNLGTVELTVALHRIFNFDKDKVLFDVGHQCYAHKLITNRSLKNLRQKGGISGFPSINESKYDFFESGHSSNSLSAALGMALVRDLNGEKYDIVDVIGDASIVNGLAFEALNDSDFANHKVIVILNDNGMSISKSVGAVTKLFAKISTSKFYNSFKTRYKVLLKLGKFGKLIYKRSYLIKNYLKGLFIRNNIFSSLGMDYIGIIDGNNEQKVESAIQRARICNKSVVVHIRTKKGFGYPLAEHDENGYYHGVSQFDPLKGCTQKNNTNSSNEIVSNQIEKIMEKHTNTMLLCPGTLVGSHFEKFVQKFGTERVKDVGIAEEHMFSLAAGLCLSNIHPILSIYSTFSQRAFDEIANDIARKNFNLTLLIDRAGLAGNDGPTHHGIFDESFFLSLPNTVVSMPSNKFLVSSLIEESMKERGLFIIRYPKCEISDCGKNEYLGYGKWNIESAKESNTIIVSFGPIINKIAERINSTNTKVDLINAIYQKPLDYAIIDRMMLKYSKIIIYNVYGVKNGFNNEFIDYLVKHNYKGQIISLAIDNKLIEHQSIEEGLEELKISLDDLFLNI
ncbi:MAG: 1-deoxy-D-xylulose-5-phosphate synthase [Bacilli bacterium]